MMTYYSAGSISVGGTATTNDRWLCDPYYDSNDMATIRPQYGRPTVGGNGLTSSSICTMLSDGTFSSLTLESGTGTKTFDSTNYFDIREIFVYNSTTVLSPGDLVIANTLSLSGTRFNMRYSFNGVTTSASTSSMQDNMPVYLVFDPTQSSGSCFKLKSPYYTQVPSDTSAIYVLVGYMSDSYRYDLWVYNPAFTWDGTKLVPYAKAALADEATHAVSADSATDSTTVNNHTVATDVPSSAVFTDENGYTLSYARDTRLAVDPDGNRIYHNQLFARTSKIANGIYYSGMVTSANNVDTTTYFDPTEIYLAATDAMVGATITAPNFFMQSGRVAFTTLFGPTIPFPTFTNNRIYLVFDRTSELNGCYQLKSPYITDRFTDSNALYVCLGSLGSVSSWFDLWYTHPMYTYIGGVVRAFPYIKEPIVTDTKDTTGASQIPSAGANSKFYLIGASAQNASMVTYTNSAVYSKAGVLYANGFVGDLTGNADTATDSTTVNSHTVNEDVPSGAVFTDTLNTTGSTDTSNKIYLVGATSQAANPQTYSDDEVYTTDGVLTTKSVQVGGGSASMVYDSTTQSINFIFT